MTLVVVKKQEFVKSLDYKSHMVLMLLPEFRTQYLKTIKIQIIFKTDLAEFVKKTILRSYIKTLGFSNI